jgi:GT2 family glycosyltransferase
MRLAFIAACHNRRELTLKAAEQVFVSADTAGVDCALTVFDDGSSDGTSESLRVLDGRISIIRGDGSAFWAKSMAAAEDQAIAASASRPSDYIVWVNDDVDFDQDFVERILASAEKHPSAVIVGATREPGAERTSYSGLVRTGVHPLHFRRIEPDPRSALPVDTFNGNLVLVPFAVARALGGVDGFFSHGLADIDYGLRCGRAGVQVLLAPGTYGECARNPPGVRSTITNDWKLFRSPKGGGNFLSLRHILRKSDPLTWWLFIAVTYTKWFVVRASADFKPRKGKQCN